MPGMMGLLLNNLAMAGGKQSVIKQSVITDDFTTLSAAWLKGDLTPADNASVSGGKLFVQPTLSAEKLTNGDFSAWSGDNPVGWSIVGTEDASHYVTEDSGKARIVRGASTFGIQQAALTAGQWYIAEIDITAVSGVATIDVYGHNTTGHKLFSEFKRNTIFNISPAQNGEVTLDNVSVKQAVPATVFVIRPLDYPISRVRARIRRTENVPKGVVLFKDANNYIWAHLGRGGSAYLTKVANGALGNPIASAAVGYVEDAYLELIPNATFTAFSVNYNEAGTNQINNVSVTDFSPTGQWYAGVIAPYSVSIDVDAFSDFRALAVDPT